MTRADLCLQREQLCWCRHSGSDSQSRKRKQQPQDTAVSSQGGLHPVPNGKAAQKAAKRQRLAATAVVDTPQTTGQQSEDVWICGAASVMCLLRDSLPSILLRLKTASHNKPSACVRGMQRLCKAVSMGYCRRSLGSVIVGIFSCSDEPVNHK